MGRAVAVLLAVVIAAPAAAETRQPEARQPETQQSGAWQPKTAGILTALHRVFRDDETGSVKIEAGGRFYRVTTTQDGLGLNPTSGPAEAPQPSDLIPGGKIAVGNNDIAMAWLADGTDRYPHGLLGDKIEASAVRVLTASRAPVDFVLREDSVFEDIAPRLVDVDRDGRDEILVVRAHHEAGASLLLLGLRGDRLTRLAESQAIGTPNRWINPVGVADFDGDGQAEIAAVETPDIGGQLVIYKIEGRRLREVARFVGYSNHVAGSAELGMSAVFDVNGDGIPDILLPSQDRRELRAVTFAKGNLAILQSVKLHRAVATALVTDDVDRNGVLDIVFGDQNGYINVILR
ncbi:MAG: FG-GAP repeat domain-containing protein [Alphaproteobacteria bacterium]